MRPRTARILVHTLTAIHATGSLVLFGMAVYVLIDPTNAEDLAQTPGARIMVDATGAWLPVAFFLMSTFFGALARASYHHHAWSWPAALLAYSIGVVGSLWQVSVGILNGWAAFAVNAFVVVALLTPGVRDTFLGRDRQE